MSSPAASRQSPVSTRDIHAPAITPAVSASRSPGPPASTRSSTARGPAHWCSGQRRLTSAARSTRYTSSARSHASWSYAGRCPDRCGRGRPA
jgi:hypothetical protein